MRSSIFSSESLRGFAPRVPSALLCALAVLGVFELGLRALPGGFLKVAGGSLGEFHYAEQDVLARATTPQVVLFGSSQAQDAMSPAAMEAALGLPTGSCVNLGVRGGRPFDALRLYQRNRERLKTAKVLLLCVDAWTFSASWPPSIRYRLYAPLEERLAFAPETLDFAASVPEIDRKRKHAELALQRQRLLLDSCLNMRVLMPYALRSGSIQLRLRKQKSWPRLSEDGRMQVRPGVPRGPVSMPAAVMENRARERCEGFAIHPAYPEHVRQLARLTAEDGVKLVLLQLPGRAAYQDAVERLYPEAHALHTKTTRALADELGVPFTQWTRPSDCGLREDSYHDYAHLADEGAATFSRFLAGHLRREGLLGE